MSEPLEGVPVDGVPYTDAQGYSRLRITERAWIEARRVGEIAGVPVVTFRPTTQAFSRILIEFHDGEALAANVADSYLIDRPGAMPSLIEPYPDAWERIQELGERSAAGRLQPADHCTPDVGWESRAGEVWKPRSVEAGAPDSGVPLTQDD